MENESSCVSALEYEMECFAWWALQLPGRVEQVTQDLLTLQRIGTSTLLADVVVARDTTARLHGLACEGGFAEVARVFSSYYEVYCRALLSMFREVS